ncbi:permease [Psychromonas sp.]|uniref:permease n=1 Tax=Psychromonas sp. TaxID=1884585 RepID=UPI0039E487FC
MLLLLSVFALFLGPLAYRLLQRQPGWLDLLDAFIFVTISGLVLFHIMPELLHSGGLMVLLLMAIGVLAPSWIEKYFHKAARQAHQTTLFLGVLGLVLHASIDGSALIVAQGDHTGWLLAIGVLLHRFPVGLTIWWLLRPQYGRLLPLAVLLSMSAATLAGGFWASDSMAQLDGQWLAWLQAFVMGSIMHVVLHRPYLHGDEHAHAHKKEDNENRYAAGIGSILGLIVLASVLLPHWLGYIEHGHASAGAAESNMMPVEQDHLHKAEYEHLNETAAHPVDEEHDHQHETGAAPVDEAEHEHLHEMAQTERPNKTALTLVNFINIALYSAPMLLLAYLLSALMHYFNPKFSVLPKQTSQSFFKDSLKGVAYGLPLPVCSPSALKMHLQLLTMGASQTFATAFLMAAPIIGFDALLISWPLLGSQMLLLRVVLAIVFAVVSAWLLGRHFKILPSLAVSASCQDKNPTSRFISAIKQGYQHQLDHTAPWVLFGWMLAATFSATPAWAFFDQALWLQVLVMIIVAFPFALCATGITPVIAVLLIAGLSPGAAIAFFLIAPTISLELLKTVKQQQGFFAALSLAMLTLGGAFLIGLGLNQYIDVISLPWLAQEEGAYNWWQLVSLILILCLYLSSLLRRGARSFIAELIPKSFLKVHHHH